MFEAFNYVILESFDKFIFSIYFMHMHDFLEFVLLLPVSQIWFLSLIISIWLARYFFLLIRIKRAILCEEKYNFCGKDLAPSRNNGAYSDINLYSSCEELHFLFLGG